MIVHCASCLISGIQAGGAGAAVIGTRSVLFVKITAKLPAASPLASGSVLPSCYPPTFQWILTTKMCTVTGWGQNLSCRSVRLGG